MQKALKLGADFWGASRNLVGVVSARAFMVVKREVKAALAVKTGIAENDGSISDMFVVDYDETLDGNSSPKSRVSRDFAEIRDENAFK